MHSDVKNPDDVRMLKLNEQSAFASKPFSKPRVLQFLFLRHLTTTSVSSR